MSNFRLPWKRSNGRKFLSVWDRHSTAAQKPPQFRQAGELPSGIGDPVNKSD